MDFEKAIKKAIEYEKEVQALYEKIAKQSKVPLAQKFYGRLAEEESRHVQFFHRKLREWLDTGKVSYERLAIPFTSKQAVALEVEDLTAVADEEEQGTLSPAVQTLLKSLRLEEMTTRFYQDIAEQLEGDKRELFSQLIMIETAHENLIKQKMKHLIETGEWPS